MFGPFHPGEVLREEFLNELGMTAEELSGALSIPVEVLQPVLDESAPVTGELALRLARYFGTSPEFWMNMQADYDLEAAIAAAGERIEREVQPRA